MTLSFSPRQLHSVRLAVSGLTVAAMALGAGAQQGRDKSHAYNPNYQVKAYELTPEMETTFSTTDDKPTPFWAAWDADGAYLNKAAVDGVLNHTWGTAAEGVSDGNVELRVAYGDSGIYVLFTAQDDAWAGYIDPIDYANDACELFGNKLSSRTLYGDNISVNLPCLNGGPEGATGVPQQLNPDYFQIQIRFGGLEPVETFSFNHWNPLMTQTSVYGCWPGSVVLYKRDLSFAQAEALYGIKIDILPDIGRSRSQEWLIPWAIWGGPNGTALTRRQSGEMVAMCFGYNDLDAGVQTRPTAMRWRNADPYSNTTEEELAGATGVHTSYDAWGDIVFAESLPFTGVNRAVVRNRAGDLTAHARWIGTSLVVEAGDICPGDMIRVMDARGRVVLSREASSSSSLPWPTGLRGVFSVRVGERSVGTFVAR